MKYARNVPGYRLQVKSKTVTGKDGYRLQAKIVASYGLKTRTVTG
jgi:hypothetical protein